jgi:hypothetical protein
MSAAVGDEPTRMRNGGRLIEEAPPSEKLSGVTFTTPMSSVLM